MMNRKNKINSFIAISWFIFLVIQLFYEGNTKDALFVVTLFNFLQWFNKAVGAAYE